MIQWHFKDNIKFVLIFKIALGNWRLSSLGFFPQKIVIWFTHMPIYIIGIKVQN
jgi:hypothetical protein